MQKNIPLSLYIHIPWCEKKCPYCDFNSHTQKGEIPEADYITTLINDLKHDLIVFKGAVGERGLSSIFIGGGTPSLFSAAGYQQLLSEIRQLIVFNDNIEITLEANPGSSEMAKFAGFREAGINRLSIGIQSFNAAHLKSLGRIHNPNEAIKAATYAVQAGFDNFNLDIMFGLPKQTLKQSLDDIERAIELSPTHLSCYQLTIEPNTLFHHNPPITPDDDALWEMQSQLQTRLSESGYQQYEVSAYAQANRQCQHNLNYWQFGDYLAIGAGAHGKLSHGKKIQRYWKIKHPTQYLRFGLDDKQISRLTGAITTIETSDIAFEFMMNALRLNAGFDLNVFERRTNLNRQMITPLLEQHSVRGMLVLNDDFVVPTPKGHQFVNSMLEDYMAD